MRPLQLHRPLVVLLVIAIGYLSVWFVVYLITPRGPRIDIRWAPSLESNEQLRWEEEFGLVRGRQSDDRTWSYELLDSSQEQIRSLITNPAVEDTHGIDRGSLTPPPRPPNATLVAFIATTLLAVLVTIIVTLRSWLIAVVRRALPLQQKQIPTTQPRGTSSVRAISLIFAACLILTLALYSFVISTPFSAGAEGPKLVGGVDVSSQFSRDDLDIVAEVADGYQWKDFISDHNGHLISAHRFLYWVLLTVSGGLIWYPWFGVTILLAHAVTCSTLGVTIWRHTGRLTFATLLALLLACSLPLSTGLLRQFANTNVYLNIISVLLVAYLLERFMLNGRPFLLATAVVCTTISIFVSDGGILCFVAVPVFGLALAPVISERHPRAWKRLVTFAVGMAVPGSIYMLVLVVGRVWYSNSLLHEWQHLGPSSLSQIDRVLANIGFQSVFWAYPFAVEDDATDIPTVIRQAKFVMGFALAFVMLWLYRLNPRNFSNAHNWRVRIASRVALGYLVLGITFVLFATSARQDFSWFLMRYASFGIVFFLAGFSIALDIGCSRLPETAGKVVRPMIVLVIVALIALNLWRLPNSRDYRRRLENQPGTELTAMSRGHGGAPLHDPTGLLRH